MLTRNMKFVLIFASLCVLAAAEDKYTTKFDNINLDELVGNDRLLNNYANCLLGKGACNPDGQALKDVLADALATDCAKCSEKQQKGGRKVIEHLIRNKKDMFAELEKIYDPNGEYKKRYCARSKDEGVDVTGIC